MVNVFLISEGKFRIFLFLSGFKKLSLIGINLISHRGNQSFFDASRSIRTNQNTVRGLLRLKMNDLKSSEFNKKFSKLAIEAFFFWVDCPRGCCLIDRSLQQLEI